MNDQFLLLLSLLYFYLTLMLVVDEGFILVLVPYYNEWFNVCNWCKYYQSDFLLIGRFLFNEISGICVSKLPNVTWCMYFIFRTNSSIFPFDISKHWSKVIQALLVGVYFMEVMCWYSKLSVSHIWYTLKTLLFLINLQIF